MKNKVLKYNKKQEYYAKLSDDNIKLKYIDLQSLYEYKNNILRLIMIVLLVGIISGLTTKVFNLIYFIIIFNLIRFMNDIREIKKEILLIEKIQNEREIKFSLFMF